MKNLGIQCKVTNPTIRKLIFDIVEKNKIPKSGGNNFAFDYVLGMYKSSYPNIGITDDGISVLAWDGSPERDLVSIDDFMTLIESWVVEFKFTTSCGFNVTVFEKSVLIERDGIKVPLTANDVDKIVEYLNKINYELKW